MKIRYLLLLLIFLAMPSHLVAGELKLGEPLTLKTVTKVSEINNNPKQYIGKRVLIEGLIIDVCAGRGCWIDIASDLPFEKIQIKVVDGEIVFPLEAKGRQARVEGVVEELNLTKEQAMNMARHHAEKRGENFDPSNITGPQTIYRIRGIGAVINSK